jgi:predicted double-glycine peptidase
MKMNRFCIAVANGAVSLGAHGRLLLSGLLLFVGLSTAQAGEVTLGSNDSGNYNIQLTSYSEIPFQTVVRQRYDYSCGSAALATLLKFHYSIETNEADVFKAMYAVGDQDRIQKLGFSLLDMKKYLASLGYQADGYRLSLAEIGQLGVPAIALIQIGSYKHFVVIKGAIGDQVLVGDPALGLRELPAAEFQKTWNGIAFVVHDQPAGTRPPVFNSAEDWKRWADAHPLTASALAQSITPFLRDLRVIYQVRPNQILPSPFSQQGALP